jgi:hypothetical protein
VFSFTTTEKKKTVQQIQSVPRGKVNILEDYNIGHSKKIKSE